MGLFRKARAAAILAALLVTTTASAQTGDGPINCDPNLQPAQETEKAREERVMCETHIGCRMVTAIFRNTCRASEFFRNLAKRENPDAPITNDDVADAATPDYPGSDVADRAMSAVRSITRPSQERPNLSETFESPNGTGYSETHKGQYYHDYGTIIYNDGSILRGETRPYSGERIMAGVGQKIWPNGQMQAGEFGSEGHLKSGVTTFNEPQGLTSILEGTYYGGAADGEMVRRYSDGSSRREHWARGKLAKVGEMAGPGAVPPPLQDVSFPLPSWGPVMMEGLYRDRAGPDRDRILLWCNRKLVAVGDSAPDGQARPPQPSECPDPQVYRDGVVRVVGKDFRTRDEYWCNGRMAAANAWTLHAPWPDLPQRPSSCDVRVKQAQANVEGEEYEPKDAIERTLGRGKTGRSGGSAGTAGSKFPCPLGGAANIYDQLRGCMNEGQINWAQFTPGADKCIPLSVAWSTNFRGASSLDGRYGRVQMPWGAIKPELLPGLSVQDFEYINRKLIEDRRQYIQQRYPQSAAWQSESNAYSQLQNCIGRAVLCNAGNRGFCN